MKFIENTIERHVKLAFFWEIQGRGTPHVEHVEVESLPSINSYLLSFTIIIKQSQFAHGLTI